MAKGVTIQISGLKELQKKLKTLPQDLIDDVDFAMGDAARKYESLAAQAAPVDQGRLKGEITSYREAVMQWVVVSPNEVSAWMEFGTRSRVQVPGDLQAYAAQFKGAGSGKGDPKKMIFDWCKRKGIEEAFWFPIFIKIMREGIHPHPFFFKHREPIKKQLNNDLKQVVGKRISK